MDYGTDISIFANGLPDFRSGPPAGSQRVSSRPALDLTLSSIYDRDTLIQDAYKLQFTPPAYLFWSRDGQGNSNPITVNVADLIGDSVSRADLASLASTLEQIIVADARFADALVVVTPPSGPGDPVIITETIQPTDGQAPIEIVINVTGSAATLVRAS